MSDEREVLDNALDASEPHALSEDVDPQKSDEKFQVDWEGLAVAVENQIPTSHSFLNRSSGRVLTIQAARGEYPESPSEPGDWLPVPPRPSREGYQTMQHFVEQLDDQELKQKLSVVLVGRGAFRRFKDILLDVPEQRQSWFAFKDTAVYAYITGWLEEEGFEDVQPPPQSSRSKFSEAVRRSSPIRPVLIQGVDEPEIDEAQWKEAIAPYDRIELLFRPARSALLVIDMQRVFVDPGGTSFLPMAQSVKGRLASLISDWRRAGRPIIFTRHVHRYPRQDGGAMSRWWRSLVMDGSWGSNLVDDLIPVGGERVIDKSRYNAFASTELEMVLRSMEIEDVVIAGVMTNLCCETTAREAFVRDFNVFFLGDGTAAAEISLHVASLRNIAYGFGRVISVKEAQEVIAYRNPTF
jgi:nicotinamidase-related amidase